VKTFTQANISRGKTNVILATLKLGWEQKMDEAGGGEASEGVSDIFALARELLLRRLG